MLEAGDGVGVLGGASEVVGTGVSWSMIVAVTVGEGLGVAVGEADKADAAGVGVVPSPPHTTRVPSTTNKPKIASRVRHLPVTIPVISFVR